VEEDLVSGAGGVESKAHGAISLPPALRKMREGRGTHFQGRAIERLGHPPSFMTSLSSALGVVEGPTQAKTGLEWSTRDFCE